MIQVFSGDGFLAREALLKEARVLNLVPRFVPPEPGVVAQEASGGLFGPSGVLVDMREMAEAEWKPLREVLEQLPPDAVVLLLDPKPTSTRSKWYNDKNNSVQKHDHPTPGSREMTNWVINRAKHHELKLPAAIAGYLGSLAGGKGSYENPAMGLEALNQELRKLTLATPPLTLEKVQALVALEVPISGFDLVRSTTEGKLNTAFKQAKELIERGEDPLRILGALSWQYVRVARAWALLQDNPMMGEGEAASTLGMHPYAAKQILLLAKGMKKAAVEGALEVLMDAEEAAKTGKDPRLALERVITQLAQLTSEARA